MKQQANGSPQPHSRITRQRRVILEELRKVNWHPSASELYELVRKRLPRVSLGTVYRNLEVLSARGHVRKLQTGGTQRRYDGNASNHYHVCCVRCGRVEDVPMELMPSLEESARQATDYEIIGHQVAFTGFCPECREGRRVSPGRGGEKKGKGKR
jgi:Fur family ferric uptake transcriptional regulator